MANARVRFNPPTHGGAAYHQGLGLKNRSQGPQRGGVRGFCGGAPVG